MDSNNNNNNNGTKNNVAYKIDDDKEEDQINGDELEYINVQELEKSLWETELEVALLTKCDYGTIRNIAKCRPIPEELRAKVWQICLNVQDKENLIDKIVQIYDLPQQDKIREDCKSLVDKFDNDMDEKMSLVSDLETIITYYCKENDELYEKDNGWLEILQPLLTLKLKKYELYNLFSAIVNRYIPRDCVRNGSPYHLFRLLLLYHDPELCSYLDTKKITPDAYAHLWVRSLFAGICNLKVILNVWDVYFQLGDQFLIFFLSLVIIINSKDQMMNLQNKEDIIEVLKKASSNLEADDIEDFCALAQHYEAKTPQSFRKEYQKPMFAGISLEEKAYSIYQALCLPVSASELLQANQLGTKGVRYFVVDCRPAEQYNSSHFATAFHLDSNLMLENQTEFNQAVETLLDAQKHAISSNSIAGGEHLCFMGSGRDEEDKYVNMVVSNFLQRKIKYISIALGGYETLAKCIEDPNSIIAMRDAIVTPNSNRDSEFNRASFTEEWIKRINTKKNDSIFNKFTNVFMNKSADIKVKIKDYVANVKTNVKIPEEQVSSSENSSSTITDFLSEKIKTYSQNTLLKTNFILNNYQSILNNGQNHVSATDKIGKRYRSGQSSNIFAIDDNDDNEAVNDNNDNELEIISIETWLNKPNVLHKFKCFEICEGKSHPAYLLVTNSHIYCLRELKNKKGMATISIRRPLSTLVKITSKKNTPELISFKYGTVTQNNNKNKEQINDKNVSDNENTNTASALTNESITEKNKSDIQITAVDQFYIPDAGEASKAVKMQVIKILDILH